MRLSLRGLEAALVSRAPDLAVFLVYDRPDRVRERPGLERSLYAQRCVSDKQLNQTIDAFRSVGAYVELFEGERPFLEALASGRLNSIQRNLKVIYNGIEGGIAPNGFEPGRKALIPSVADSYGLVSSNSDAYACALGRHKFHYLTLLRALGVPTPPVWHYRLGPTKGWAVGRSPPEGVKVIAKSTYESWSVGVSEDSVFVVDGACDERVAEIADAIGQPVTVQEFISGREICAPILACPDRIVTPPVEAVLAKAPGDLDAFMTLEDNLRNAGVVYRRFSAQADLVEEVRRRALAAFDTLQLRSFARIDFRVDEGGRAWLIDVGVSPGLSDGSSAFHSLAELGFDHPTFLRLVVAATLGSHGLIPSCHAKTRPPAS